MELFTTVQEWTKTKRGQEEKERQGRESPECKAMFGRNVRPPVRACNLTGNSPENCLTDAGREKEGEGGGSKMDSARGRWVEDKESCTSNHRSFFMFLQFNDTRT